VLKHRPKLKRRRGREGKGRERGEQMGKAEQEERKGKRGRKLDSRF